MKNITLTSMGLGLLLATGAQADEPVRIGMITTLSGPAGYLGQDIRDGFQLAIENSGGTLGGQTVELIVEDDGLNPGNGRQIADRMLSQGIDLFTGVVFANVAAATVPEILDSDALYVSPNTSSSFFAGEDCNPNYFVSSWQDDSQGESAGALAELEGHKSAFLVAPNYQAGRETMVAFRRFFTGEIVGEVYTGLDQTDFASEIAQIRDAQPDMVYEFEPGGLGIAFIKQYQQAGLLGEIPLVVHPASLDHAILQAVGEAAEGILVTSHWNTDFDNPVNAEFVETWRATYGDRPITYYAAQGYDAALLFAQGLQDNADRNRDTFRSAVLENPVASVRGEFTFGPNQHPVQDWYALKVIRDDAGTFQLSTASTVLEDHSDVYAEQCQM